MGEEAIRHLHPTLAVGERVETLLGEGRLVSEVTEVEPAPDPGAEEPGEGS